MAILMSSYNIFNYIVMHAVDCKLILDKQKDETMKKLWDKIEKSEGDIEKLDKISQCIERNSIIALSTCFLSCILVYLIGKYITFEPLDAGLIIYEKAFNISSNMTNKIRQIMSVS